MPQKLTFIEEAEFKGYKYRPNGLLGNGFYGNSCFVSLAEMERNSRMCKIDQEPPLDDDAPYINSEFFIECELKDNFLTTDIVRLFPTLKEHHLHNFLNRFKDVFLSQKLFTLSNRKRVFTTEAVRFIYAKLIKREETPVKKRGRRAQ